MAHRRGLLFVAHLTRRTLTCSHSHGHSCSVGLRPGCKRAQGSTAVKLFLTSHPARGFSTDSYNPQGHEQRGPGWWEWLLLIPGITTFGLGTWQLQRMQEKEKLLDMCRRQLELDPIPLGKAVGLALGLELELGEREDGGDGDGDGDVSAAREKLEYKRVVCSGEYDESRNLYLGPRVRTLYGVSEKGYYVITPLLPSPDAKSSDTAVLVNRGWVPSSWREEHDLAAGKSKPSTAVGSARDETKEELEQLSCSMGKGEGVGEIVGVIRASEQPSSFVPSNAASIGQWFYVDVSAMAEACQLPPNKTILVDLVGGPQNKDNNNNKPMIAFPLPKDPGDLVHARVMPHDHFNYALTWYTLSAATTFMAWKRMQPKRRLRI